MVVLGDFILRSAGSASTPARRWRARSRISVIAVNTMLASAAGASMPTSGRCSRFGKSPIVTMMCKRSVGRPGGHHAPCAFVECTGGPCSSGRWRRVVVGSALFIERTLKVDDPVGRARCTGCAGLGASSAWACFRQRPPTAHGGSTAYAGPAVWTAGLVPRRSRTAGRRAGEASPVNVLFVGFGLRSLTPVPSWAGWVGNRPAPSRDERARRPRRHRSWGMPRIHHRSRPDHPRPRRPRGPTAPPFVTTSLRPVREPPRPFR
jgi:hypothetical protein